MLRWAADENFNADIIRGAKRRFPSFDVVPAQHVGLSGTDDPTLLEWCGSNQRLLLTHDAKTFIGFAYDRVRHGESMPGIVVAAQSLPIGQAIEEIVLLAECSNEGEWEG